MMTLDRPAVHGGTGVDPLHNYKQDKTFLVNDMVFQMGGAYWISTITCCKLSFRLKKSATILSYNIVMCVE